MAKIRVMFQGHGPSNLPEDRVINVFHFVGLGTYEDELPSVFAAVEAFYNASNTTRELAAYQSPYIQRDAELLGYDLDEPPKRVPTRFPVVLSAVASATQLPEEVAVCLSIRGSIPPAGGPRRRGRLFVGPLNILSMTSGPEGAPTRPSPAFVADLIVAAERLEAQAISAGTPWVIRSTKPTQNFVAVQGGYVDNAMDTQRRRGPRTTERTEWPTA